MVNKDHLRLSTFINESSPLSLCFQTSVRGRGWQRGQAAAHLSGFARSAETLPQPTEDPEGEHTGQGRPPE